MYVNNITKPAGTNAAGLSNTLLIAPTSWFSTIAMPTVTPTTPGDTILIEDDHEFTVTSPLKGFVEIYTTQRTGEIKYSPTGPLDSKGVIGSYEAKSPGINMALWELLSQQDEFIVLAQDIDCSNTNYYQLGTSCSGTLAGDWEFVTGKGGGEGEKTTTIKFEFYGDRPLIYTGTVQLAVQP